MMTIWANDNAECDLFANLFVKRFDQKLLKQKQRMLFLGLMKPRPYDYLLPLTYYLLPITYYYDSRE